jgi:hypothetical protein
MTNGPTRSSLMLQVEAKMLEIRAKSAESVPDCCPAFYTDEVLEQLKTIIPKEVETALSKAFWQGKLRKSDGEALTNSILDILPY